MKKDYTGMKFNMLTAVGPALKSIGVNRWHFECDCGKKRTFEVEDVIEGIATSCGCVSEDYGFHSSTLRHGLTNTTEHWTWSAIQQRCYYEKADCYYRYGAVGIEMCDRWNPKKGGSFENFLEDMGSKPGPEYSIERIDSAGDYTPENCKWATKKEQSRNTSQNRKLTINGVTKCLIDWSKESPIDRKGIVSRLERGWSAEDAVFKPPVKNFKKYRTNKTTLYDVYGEKLSVPQIRDKYNVAETTFRRWYGRGLSAEDIIEKYGAKN